MKIKKKEACPVKEHVRKIWDKKKYKYVLKKQKNKKYIDVDKCQEEGSFVSAFWKKNHGSCTIRNRNCSIFLSNVVYRIVDQVL